MVIKLFLTDVRVGVGRNMSADLEIIAVVVIVFEVVVSVPYAVDVLAGEVVDVLIDGLSGVIIVVVTTLVVTSGGGGESADANVNGLELTMPSPPEESVYFCRSSSSCWSKLACDRVLHARMPSYHVC